MLKTGKPTSEGQAFRRRLLSEYIVEFTLDNYVSYYDLKKLVKEAEHLRLEGEYRKKKFLESTVKSHESSPLSVVGNVIPSSLNEVPLNSRELQAFRANLYATPPEIEIATNGSSHDNTVPPIEGGEGSCLTQFTKGSTTSKGSMLPFPLSSRLPKDFLRNDPILTSLRVGRESAQEAFFQELEKSYRKVKSFLIDLEKKIMRKMVELHSLTEVRLRAEMPLEYIPTIYLQLECVLKYRELNLLAFRKIMQKFLQRCACDSLELQRRVYEVDELISRSNVNLPSLDLRGVALKLIGIYGTVFRHTYEEAVLKLSQFVCRAGVVTPRILSSRDTFFASPIPHLEPSGGFAVKILAGTRSLVTEKMVAEVLRCRRYPLPDSRQFPNGEIHVNLPESVRGDDVYILQSIVAAEAEHLSHSGAAMELLLMIHAAQLAAAVQITAGIPYLPYTRNIASIAALAEMIELAGCHHVITVDLNSSQVEGVFAIPLENVSPMYEFVRYITNELRREGHQFENLTVVSPDGNHVGKAKDFADALMSYAGLNSQRQFVDVCTVIQSPCTRQECCTQHNNNNNSNTNKKEDKTGFGNVRKEGDSQLSRDSSAVAWESRDQSPTAGSPASITSSLTSQSGSPVDKYLKEPSPSTNSTNAMLHIKKPPAPLFSYTQMTAAREGSNTLLGDIPKSSTLRMEKALKYQEKGRQAIVRKEMEDAQSGHKNIHLVGDVKGRLCIVLETEINEAVETANLAKCLAENGAERILIIATHAVLAGGYRERLLAAPIERIIVTDTIPQDDILWDPKLAEKFRVLPIAPLLARAIEKIHTESNLSTLFEK